MTKSERLLYLIRLMREGKGIRLKALSETCQVSQRTIYRDLISLSRVNVPVRLEKSGYKISRENSSLGSLAEFPNELDLLRLILRTSELARTDQFAGRIAALDNRLAKMQKSPDNGGNRSKIRFSEEFQLLSPQELVCLIIPFFVALKEGLPIRIGHATPQRYSIAEPTGMIIGDHRTQFLYRLKGKKEIATSASSDIESITLLQKCKLAEKVKTG